VLPAVVDAAPKRRARRKATGAPRAASLSTRRIPFPLTVLVVDDLQDARDMYRQFLEFHGARVITAADGADALEALERQRPDAIVIDLAMPRLTGWEVIRAVRKDRAKRTIPILAVTGQGTRESALDAGADGFLSKPCLPDHLFAEILRILEHPSGRTSDH
jgi:CheY-like chemotaxis protein